MYIKKAGLPEYEELFCLYDKELIETGKDDVDFDSINRELEELLNNGCLQPYVVIDGGRVVSVCYCNIIHLLPMPGVNTKYFFISDVYTIPRCRHSNFESLLIKYVKCEMGRHNIQEYKF